MKQIDEWQPLFLAIFVLIISVVIGHITFQFKEHFMSDMTRAPYPKSSHQSQGYLEQIKVDTKNAYKNMFNNRIPTYSDHPCHPSCCTKSTALSCSHGCVCLTDEDEKMFNNH